MKNSVHAKLQHVVESWYECYGTIPRVASWESLALRAIAKRLIGDAGAQADIELALELWEGHGKPIPFAASWETQCIHAILLAARQTEEPA